jgi:hypothetical protein
MHIIYIIFLRLGEENEQCLNRLDIEARLDRRGEVDRIGRGSPLLAGYY